MLATVAPPVLAAPPVFVFATPPAVSCNTTKWRASETQIEAGVYHAGPTNYGVVNSLDTNGKPVYIAVDILAPEYLLRWEEPRVRIGADGQPITECVGMSEPVSNLAWTVSGVSLRLTPGGADHHDR